MSATPIELRVPEQAAGTRLDRFLAVPLGSRARAQTLIDAGRVRVDGALAPKRHLVAAGEAIEIDDSGEPGPVLVPEAQASFEVAYEDEYLLVVDKPAGVVVHPARGHWAGTLAQALAGRAAGGEEPWRAGIVHRLDRDTSGLLVVAKSDAVHRALKSLLVAQRDCAASTWRWSTAIRSARTGTIDAPIGRHRRDRKLMSIDTDEPREARTHFEIERLLPGAPYCASCSRPVAPTRSACIWPRSAIRCAATPSTEPAGEFGLYAAVPARRPAGVRAPGDQRAGRRRPRRCPDDLVAALAMAERVD